VIAWQTCWTFSAFAETPADAVEVTRCATPYPDDHLQLVYRAHRAGPDDPCRRGHVHCRILAELQARIDGAVTHIRFSLNVFECTGDGAYLTVAGDDAEVDAALLHFPLCG
jgi:hypothetical protein